MGSFLAGLLIGTIKSVSGEGPGMFLSVTIAPKAVDFRGLEQVLVVTQMPEQLITDSRRPKAGEWYGCLSCSRSQPTSHC